MQLHMYTGVWGVSDGPYVVPSGWPDAECMNMYAYKDLTGPTSGAQPTLLEESFASVCIVIIQK